MGKITVDRAKCTGCTVCTQVCIYGDLVTGPDGKAQAVDGRTCMDCGHCIAACPSGAIIHSMLDSAAFPSLGRSSAAGYEQFVTLLRTRRSRREFKDTPVPREVIEKLLAAAVEAPSSLNHQSIQYTVITDREVLKQIPGLSIGMFRRLDGLLGSPIGRIVIPKRIRDGLSQLVPLAHSAIEGYSAGRDTVMYSAPCLMLLHAPKSDIYAPNDAPFSAQNILLAAETLGLGACVVGFVSEPTSRNKAMKSLVQVPQDHTVLVAIALGYPKFRYARSVPKRPPTVRYV